jgi:2-succinyl-5-enolpyruvyl-6-hydroxy-3-cyclohexene-1-carboxylate synthase
MGPKSCSQTVSVQMLVVSVNNSGGMFFCVLSGSLFKKISSKQFIYSGLKMNFNETFKNIYDEQLRDLL